MSINPVNPIYPEVFTVQVPSWDIYEDWEQTGPDGLLLYPGGPSFRRLTRAIQAYDDQLRQEELANPDTFAVERRAKWAVTQDAYLRARHVLNMFAPFLGQPLFMRTGAESLATRYVGHGDHGKTQSNFGFAIGHVAGYDERGLPHVVFDVLHAWRPVDYLDHVIDYIAVEKELEGYIKAFHLELLSFDQYNSIGSIQRLRAFASEAALPNPITIDEVTATADSNWEVAERFKAALGLGLVHAPAHDLAQRELLCLTEKNRKVDHQATGETTTKDIADCIMRVTDHLIGNSVDQYVFGALSDTVISGSQPGGMNAHDSAVHNQFAVRRRPKFGPSAPRSRPSRRRPG